MSSESKGANLTILADTGSAQTIMERGIIPVGPKVGEVMVRGLFGDPETLPVHQVYLDCPWYTGEISVGLVKKIPTRGIQMLLGEEVEWKSETSVPSKPGNVLVESEEPPTIELKNDSIPVAGVKVDDEWAEFSTLDPEVLNDPKPVSVVTRSKLDTHRSDQNAEAELGGNLMYSLGESRVSREVLIESQQADEEIGNIYQKVTDGEGENSYQLREGVLVRKYTEPGKCNRVGGSLLQVLVPREFREGILRLAHDLPESGHFGQTKTLEIVRRDFWWPNMRGDIQRYCQQCHVCQVVGKPNQNIPVAELEPIPVMTEPFEKLVIDCVGPLPPTRAGNRFLLTIMCVATRYVEAFPLRNIKTKAVLKTLENFCSTFGWPKEVQSDQGTNFTSKLTDQWLTERGITQVFSTAYHPESQGCLERSHQTVKTMMKKYVSENEKDWDQGLHLMLFALRNQVNESLGFTPYELVFGHTVKGPLQTMKDIWVEGENEKNLLQYVSDFNERLHKANVAANIHLKGKQRKMKFWYDRHARKRNFNVGDQVLVLIPTQNQPLEPKFCGPYVITEKTSDLNYVVGTPDRRKSVQHCHINMLKPYYEKAKLVNLVCLDTVGDDMPEVKGESIPEAKVENSQILADLPTKFEGMTEVQQLDLTRLIEQNLGLFSDKLGLTTSIVHDIEQTSSSPIKQRPYRMSPDKAEIVRKEVEFMLKNDLIEPSLSPWSSPVLLVPKSDGSFRMCQDFRKVNSVTKAFSYPMPRIEDCVDTVGSAKFVTKLDLMKGYWQVPLSDRAREISAFSTTEGLYQNKRMPFGLRNACGTFQKLMNELTAGISNCTVYIDDVLVTSETWGEHMETLRLVFERLSKANLTINLAKSEFGKASVTYLGHEIGLGVIKPRDAKVRSILDYPVPRNPKDIQRFLGLIGFYRKFIPQFSEVAVPITSLLKKRVKFKWSDECQSAFEKLKALLIENSVLKAPDYKKSFSLQVDASDFGIGSVLLQEDEAGEIRPVAFFSRKLTDCQKNYSTIEKETLALLLSLQHFEVYVGNPQRPVKVYTDHNPLVFLSKMKNNNRRILRWSLIIMEFNVEISHIKGKENVVADKLSRIK